MDRADPEFKSPWNGRPFRHAGVPEEQLPQPHGRRRDRHLGNSKEEAIYPAYTVDSDSNCWTARRAATRFALPTTSCRPFAQTEKDKISTENLLHALVARDNGEPWAHFWEKDLRVGNIKGPAGKVARHLKTFGIVSCTIREDDGSTPKGYKLSSFEDAFSRYLP